jgi:polyvinyl alcohol dehydrogenase (cytochrome)
MPASLPTFFALDAATGQIKWQFVSGGSVNSGAAIVNGVVYWGSGYSNFGLGSANNKFYAFGLK